MEWLILRSNMCVLHFFLNILSVLWYIYSFLQVIHRDLAARNCLLDKKNRVKITDFGLGLALEGKTSIVKRGRAPIRSVFVSFDDCFHITTLISALDSSQILSTGNTEGSNLFKQVGCVEFWGSIVRNLDRRRGTICTS